MSRRELGILLLGVGVGVTLAWNLEIWTMGSRGIISSYLAPVGILSLLVGNGLVVWTAIQKKRA